MATWIYIFAGCVIAASGFMLGEAVERVRTLRKRARELKQPDDTLALVEFFLSLEDDYDAVRIEAKANGWTTKDDEYDYCSECSKKPKRV